MQCYGTPPYVSVSMTHDPVLKENCDVCHFLKNEFNIKSECILININFQMLHYVSDPK